ncbi:homoserine kinase [Glaciimonas sp. CA11.2]|uniref:homoserine kinase n=1 Tax=unclassified Glaciimonas TaxID=2644401 RepID=UPI002AB50507|nr:MULTISPECIES: homoserine kinase [unclassified Glaciimonas]MDY7545440.1 homoserine kinase [Glaciimonas sp. CA11.2]MEB0013336.1 homoserine kinase [Glaciimonas sp. Cout2]MEB0082753.1 homoserine kinase [Glaciimonas sp. Gout2]MEB0161945.1 homoserine kinase [Glaciimonas sp. CA11.2]
MAVFTPVSLDDLSQWLSQFPLGKALAIKGISSGIENSNFFINTEAGEYVLTVFEKLTFEQLPFYLELMRHLAQRGVAVPAPIANQHGALINALHGKPAAIVSKLRGESEMSPGPVHCREVGVMLAKMHLAAQDFPIYQPNLRGLAWWRDTAPAVLPFLPAEIKQLLGSEIKFQEDFAVTATYQSLSKGPVHADLFRNNVMFDGDKLSGFFDFYFAGCDTWLFDLAVTVNDWCIDVDTGELDEVRVAAMLDGYRSVQAFSSDDQTAWQPMLRAAALRFWLSRLYDFYLPRAAEMLTPHDPAHFERILRQRIAHPAPALL